ncbi:MAG: cation transporter [Planctomycetes bacterium]|jgi:divalent metal cation (Fe/Co/Zn/Cd) transporter|nr:cation transporter [Planctomycetota bacterium]
MEERGVRWSRIAIRLVAVTMAWNCVEAVIAVWSGIAAGSIALVGFGLDSVIEVAAAAVVLWRLAVEARGRSTREEIERTERRVHRFVGGTFLALAVYVLVQAGFTLFAGDAPEESLVGILLAVASLVVMPIVALGKFRAARELGSGALRAEAKETLACAWLSLALLIGLLGNALLGWWQADPVAALAMVPWLVKEGLEALRGEGCCAGGVCRG